MSSASVSSRAKSTASSVGASSRPLPPEPLGATCIEFPMEGEQLCRAGDFRKGVQYLERALSAGTTDLRVLGAIYSQLGNAYFTLGDYHKALEYQRYNLTLARFD